MAIAVVDTAVLIGMADAGDQHHVVLETLNWIHNRNRHEKTHETYARLNASAGFEIHQAAQKDFTRALELLETHEGLSFGDASIVAYMQREDIEYLYSFDDDFDAIDGIARLATLDNPFE